LEPVLPVYQFQFTKQHGTETVDGIFLANETVLQQEAIRSALDIMHEGLDEGLDRSQWVLHVFDAQGRLVLHLPFAKLLQPD
jgi:hypothetical protein